MMNKMEGAEEKDDVVMQCQMPQALAALHGMVRASAAAAGGKRTWEFRGVHIGKGPAEGASLDDFLTAFLHWCQKDEDRAAGRFNVSKVCLNHTLSPKGRARLIRASPKHATNGSLCSTKGRFRPLDPKLLTKLLTTLLVRNSVQRTAVCAAL